MKNRFLPLSLITAFFGLTLLLVAKFSVAGQPGNPDLRKPDGTVWDRIQANQKTGQVNLMDLARAREQADALKEGLVPGGLGLYWQSIGPDNFPGMIWSAIFDKNDASGNTLLAGAAYGGVWKSYNLGLTWEEYPVANSQALRVSSLAQLSDGTLYAATGIATCKTVNAKGTGIYRSVGGAAFNVIASTLANPDFDAVTKLAVSPQSNRLFAATVGGLYYSDNGDQWTKVRSGFAMDVTVGNDGTVIAAIGDSAYLFEGGNLSSPVVLTTGSVTGLPNIGVGWMTFAIAPSDNNVIYASLAEAIGKLYNIYLSTDKGATWSVIFPSNGSFEPFGGYGCYANTMAVFPNDPYKLYLGSVNMWYGQRVLPTGFYNWEQISFGSFGSLSPYYAPNYHHSYMFRPNAANQVLLATDRGVSVATNNGEEVTFQTSNKNLKTAQFRSLAFSSQKGYAMGGGPRIGTLAMGYFCPSAVSFPSNGYQVWRTDASSLGANSQPQPSNYGGNGGTCVWSSVDPRVAVYIKNGNSKIRRQDFTDINYYNLFAQGLKTDTAGRVPMQIWETWNQQEAFGITRDSVKFVTEQIAIPADTTIMIRSNSNGVLFPYVTTAPIPKGDSIIVADPIAGRLFISADSSGVGKGIFMTKDMLVFKEDPEYYVLYKNSFSTDQVSAIGISTDVNTLWAGTEKGKLIRITNIKNAYDSATANITSSQCVLVNTEFFETPLKDRFVTSISIDPSNPARVLVTLGNTGNQDYVYYTQNGFDANPQFVSIQGNLPQMPVNAGLIEMHGNAVLVGNDYGLYSAQNVGSGTPTWSGDMQGIGDVAVTDIRQQVMRDYHIPNYGVIYIATYGLGILMDTTFYTPLGIDAPVAAALRGGELKLTPNPVKDNLQVTYQNSDAGNLELMVYDISGRMVYYESLGYHAKGTVSAHINLAGLARGSYIVRLGSGFGKIVRN